MRRERTSTPRYEDTRSDDDGGLRRSSHYDRLQRYSDELVREARHGGEAISLGREFSGQEEAVDLVDEFTDDAKEFREFLGSESFDIDSLDQRLAALSEREAAIDEVLRDGRASSQVISAWGRTRRILREMEEVLASEVVDSRGRGRSGSNREPDTRQIIQIIDDLEWSVPDLIVAAENADVSEASLRRLETFKSEVEESAEKLDRSLQRRDLVVATLDHLVDAWRTTRDVVMKDDRDLFSIAEWKKCHNLVLKLQRELLFAPPGTKQDTRDIGTREDSPRGRYVPRPTFQQESQLEDADAEMPVDNKPQGSGLFGLPW